MLNISRQIYTAIDTKQTRYELPEAEIVPGGETANEKKRLGKITSKYGAVTEYENIPLPGFTLHKTDRKNWGSIDQSWLVIDPRGFLVRISSENLERILHVTGVTEGLIQEQCVWAREDSQTKLTLVPVTSEKFKEAVSNTELLEGKVSIKDVKIGDSVLLQNGLTGIYRGVASLYGTLEDYSSNNEHKPQVHLRRQIVEITTGKFFYNTDAKILKITNKAPTPITREESVEYMNGHILADTAFFGSNTNVMLHGRYYTSRSKICHVSVHAVPKPILTLTEINNFEATKIFHDCQLSSDAYQLVLERNGDKFVVDFPYAFSSPAITIHGFDISKISLTVDNYRIFHFQKRDYSSYRGSMKSEALDKFTKFYKIVKHVKNESYV